MASAFDRIRNLWSGFLSLFLEGVEVKNPEAVYEAAINERVSKYERLKKAVSGIVYLRNKLQSEYDVMKAELTEISPQIDIAVESNEDEAALILIAKKEKLEKDMASKEAELSKVKEQADDAKSGLMAFQAEINQLKAEKEAMLAKKATAEARIQINDQISGISTEADVKALDNVRTSIEKLHAEADVSTEIGGSSLDARLKKIKEKAGDMSAKSKLAEMKKQLAAKRGDGVKAPL